MASPRQSDEDDERPHLRRSFTDDAYDLAGSLTASLPGSTASRHSLRGRFGIAALGRRTLGILLLLVTVFLWTLSNFLASFIFSDHTYDNPFFLVYVNSSFFVVMLMPYFVRYLRHNGTRSLGRDILDAMPWRPRGYHTLDDDTGVFIDETASVTPSDKLDFRSTVRLALEFSPAWFMANYFASACFEFTSVASGTILTSTSSVWTLVLCAMMGVEAFSVRKLLGVLTSLAGVVLISTLDLSGEGDEDNGSFPDKTAKQIAIGDAMAFFSALVYGLYATVMKKRVGDEDRVDMRLFFGMIGVFILTLSWPLFIIFHYTGVEPFEMPPSGQIWAIILVNSLASLVADISWAFAMLLTTPLIVTVGLSLTIPLSLIGEMIQYGKQSSVWYWLGAAIVLLSFLFIFHESPEEASKEEEAEPA